MSGAFLHTPYGDVHFRKLGSGERLLIALHGFGVDSSVFQCLEPPLRGIFTLYAIDLPFHGQTRWAGKDFSPEQLEVVINAILQQEGRQRFEALGHSLGGRLWLCLLGRMEGRLDALYLLAPDGLQTRWMGLAERMPLLLRRLAGQLATRPARGLALARGLQQRGLIDGFVIRYLVHHLGDNHRRNRLLYTWYALSNFPLNAAKARKYLYEFQAPTLVLLGKQDQLIPARALLASLKGINHVHIREVDANHQNICQLVAPFLVEGLF